MRLWKRACGIRVIIGIGCSGSEEKSLIILLNLTQREDCTSIMAVIGTVAAALA